MKAIQDYVHFLQEISQYFGLTIRSEHEFIHEFFEEKIPVFKIALLPDKKSSQTVIAFHVDIDPATAVQWWEQLRAIYPPLKVTANYITDHQGNTCVGETAEVLKRYLLEQEIISAYIESDMDDDAVLNKKPHLELLDNKIKDLTSQETALEAFHNLRKRTDDQCH